MDCPNCETRLCEFSELFFYYKGEKDVILSIKPECLRLVLKRTSLKKGDHDKVSKAVCGTCSAHAGSIMPFGPNGTDIYSFGCSRIKLNEKKYTKKKKWWMLYTQFNMIDVRNAETFDDPMYSAQVIQNSKIEIASDIVFPSYSKLDDFEWYTVSPSHKEPRLYQIEGYVKSLLSNLIVVIPTGGGKTLIASMFIAKMCQLNPSKMAVMIVDCVPLAIQQCEALKECINQSIYPVLKIYGENKDKYLLNQLKQRRHRILVVTAGVFLGMLNSRHIDIGRFCAVVLDECHHVTKGHNYVNVMKIFQQRPANLQPRILGLTASPVNAKTLDSAFISMEVFLTDFPKTTRLFFPDVVETKRKTKIIEVEKDKKQDDFIKRCLQEFKILQKEIKDNTGLTVTSINLDLSNCNQVIGQLREYELQSQGQSAIRDAIKISYAMYICEVMGISFGYGRLANKKAEGRLVDLFEEFRGEQKVSSRLLKLEETLESLNHSSKALVFVSTKMMAKILTTHLQKKYPVLNIERIVGRSGPDGMLEEEQKEIIQKFSSTEGDSCKLLVCTSVLEEGIDLPSCNLVVFFTGVQSLIQFTQGGGRGRKDGSRLIVLQSKDQSSKKRDMEKEMKYLRKELTRRIQQQGEDNSEPIIQSIKKELKDLPLKNRKQFIGDSKSDFSFTVYADPAPGIKPADIQEELTNCLNSIQEFVLTRLDLVETDSCAYSLAKGAFSNRTLQFIVGVKCEAKSSTVREKYDAFCLVFQYWLEFKGKRCYMWTKLKQHSGDVKDQNVRNIEAIGMDLGHFRDKISYVRTHRFNGKSNVFFRDKEIVIEYNKAESKRTEDEHAAEQDEDELIDEQSEIIIPNTSLGNFFLLSSGNKAMRLAFCLNHCPIIYNTAKEPKKRVTVRENSDLGLAFGKFPLVLLKFHKDNLEDLINILEFNVTSPYFNVKLQRFIEEDIRMDLMNLDNMKEILWSLKFLEDSREIMYLPATPSIVEDFMKDKPDKKSQIEKVIHRRCMYSSKYYFTDFMHLLSQEYNIFKDMVAEDIHEDIVPKQSHALKRVIITQLRMSLFPAVPVASNRVLRKFAEKYQIIVVSFRDEDGTQIRSAEDEMLQRVKSCLLDGISVNGISFQFLFATSSQLRDHKAYFTTANAEEVLSIRQDIIPEENYENFDSPAKYFARLGMYGTADICIGQLSMDRVAMIDDIKASNGDIVTDGAGKISLSKAKEITKILNLQQSEEDEDPPSAFQIRYAGIKGILVTTPDDDIDLQGKDIAVRKKSMRKFENKHENFCITRISLYNEFKLNRELISLLNAIESMDQEKLNETLFDYQNAALKKSIAIFSDIDNACSELKGYFELPVVKNLSAFGKEILCEGYWFSLLQGIYRIQTKEIRSKTSIVVNKSCLLVGVPDPRGVLEEGEVFVQIKPPESTNKTIEQPILLFRNPCLHPGDIQRVQGVFREELKHLVNVVVFPIKNCEHSLAASCSGGDLDGDQYAVIWDENLVPPEDGDYPACDYSGLAKRAAQCLDEEELKKDLASNERIAKYFITFMSNDCLGRIAHKHLALCDKLDKGARDEMAVKLAECQSQAVDFPKTGIKPDLPEDAMKTANEYPDFMGKVTAESYLSKKILGQMYRACYLTIYEFEDNVMYNSHFINSKLTISGSEKYFESAIKNYTQYAHDMKMLLKKFELEVEADVALGQATVKWSIHLESDKGKAGKVLKKCRDILTEKYREIFFSDINNDDEKWKKASAWYQLVNNPECYTEQMKTDELIYKGFPWVVTDVLCQIRRQSEKNEHEDDDMFITIGKSVIDHFQRHSKQLISDSNRKLEKYKAVDEEVSKLCKNEYGLSDGFLVVPYGSTSIFVCESESDIDVCILPRDAIYNSNAIPEHFHSKFNERDQQIHFLESIILSAVGEICQKPTLLETARIPIIKCFFQDDGDQQVQCDISMNKDGYRKTLYFHHLYELSPLYLPLMWILVRWARLTGIVKSMENENKIIDTAEFYALVIQVLNLPKMNDSIEILENSSHTTSIEAIVEKMSPTSEVFKEIGNEIFEFFRKASSLHGDMEIKWSNFHPDIEQSVTIRELDVEQIQNRVKHAYHVLSATRNANALIEFFLLKSNQKGYLEKELPLSLTLAIGKARSFHANRLHTLTGALVNIEFDERKSRLVLRGKGDQLMIENLRKELCLLRESNNSLVTAGRLAQKCSRYFMCGSSIILVKNNSDVRKKLTYTDTIASYELHHEQCQRSAVSLHDNDDDNDDGNDNDNKDKWREDEVKRLSEHVINQMNMLPNDNKLLQSLEITSKFGSYYLIDADNSFDGETNVKIEELQLRVEKNRRSRTTWQRSEFNADYDMIDIDEDDVATAAEESAPKTERAVKLEEKIKMELNRPKIRRSGIAASFSPGLLKNNCKDPEVLTLLFNKYREALEKLNFKAGNQCTSREVSPAWKISMNPSASYEVQLYLDENFKIIKLAERPLNWVHGTILDGKGHEFNGEIRKNSDIRLLISTKDNVDETHDLYQSVVPRGVLPFEVKDGRPVLTHNNKETRRKGNKNFVSVIRNVKQTEIYTNNVIDACITCGDVYFGDRMEMMKPFCELSLLFDKKTLENVIQNIENPDSLRNYIEQIFHVSCEMKDVLDKAVAITK